MRKETKKYFFSVEGETEKWYFDWLKNKIKTDPQAKYEVSFDCKIEKDPLKRAKGIVSIGKTEITHIFDYESNESSHVQLFEATLDRMKESESSKVGKSITYCLGYSNFTFELWMILHKCDCNGILSNRDQYLIPINRAYGESFENLDHYKREDSFKRVLNKLELQNVRDAIRRSKSIMQNNQASGLILQKYRGYSYYKENPSLSIYEIIEKILKDCKLI